MTWTLARGVLAGLLLAYQPAARSQADFRVVWVVVGEAAAASGDDHTGAGRRLFMASELADFALRHINVARVDAQPVISELNVGDRVCITSMKILAYNAEGATIKQAPLSISIRQDHKESIGLTRSKTDICMVPSAPGEYPVRFTSLLPAKDGTMRGAQIFVRVKEAAEVAQ